MSGKAWCWLGTRNVLTHKRLRIRFERIAAAAADLFSLELCIFIAFYLGSTRVPLHVDDLLPKPGLNHVQIHLGRGPKHALSAILLQHIIVEMTGISLAQSFEVLAIAHALSYVKRKN